MGDTAFTHLHVHSEYSLLDGACRIGPLIAAAKSSGMTSLAITDHGVMYGVVDFYKQAAAAGIKPILGCECYVASRSRFDKVHGTDSQRYHLVLLAETNEGYQNLMKLCSLAYTEGFYGKPRIDRELLERYHTGIIALSACLAGEIPRMLSAGNYEAAKNTAMWYKQCFAGTEGQPGFYLEMQDHGIEEQLRLNLELMRLSRELDIPLCVTNDVHYISREDSKMQRVLILVGTNKTVEDDDTLEFETEEFYLKDEFEMRALFPSAGEAIDNTAAIAERCNVTLTFNETKLPNFDTPDNADHFEYFRAKCAEGMLLRYGGQPATGITERMEYELDVINSMGYTDYYLIVADFIAYAKNSGISVGPGRGSGAGSLCAYLMGITDIDPLKYNLLFERFLNPERVTMPDFDIDFCYVRRQEVIDYCIAKYGKDKVAQIVTFGTLAARAAIRDVGRALAIPYQTVDQVAKMVPFEAHSSIERALKQSPELKTRYESDPQIAGLIDMARKVEGMPRHASTHAAGVVITRDAVSDYVPLALNDESIVTQFPMGTLEELGLLKIDFLGLRTLTVIDDTLNMLARQGVHLKSEDIPIDDEKTYAMLGMGQCDGVFQFESGGMRSVMSQLKPTELEDLIAVISLYRPGPMDSIPRYIRGRHNRSSISYKTPELASILDVTNGCMVYQEQVMEVFRKLAGYSLGRADIVRRAMSKKKHDVLERERSAFVNGTTAEEERAGAGHIDGCVRRGIPAGVANGIFDDMTSFASYAFNKSHAAAYALVAYKTAYLKCHYPAPFFAALLTSVLSSTGRVAEYIASGGKLGVRTLPPHVNSSFKSFDINGREITFGLLTVKNLGHPLIDALIAERQKGGEYKSFYDFCRRLYSGNLNRRALESLIKCGALDGLGAHRAQMLHSIDNVLGRLEQETRRNLEGQVGFFDMGQAEPANDEFILPDCEELPPRQLLQMEKEVIGLYISGHPLEAYRGAAERLNARTVASIFQAAEEDKLNDNEQVGLLVMVGGVRQKITKSGQAMAFVEAEDITGTINATVFPKILAANSALLRTGEVIFIRGRIQLREDRPPELLVQTVETAAASSRAGNNGAADNLKDAGQSQGAEKGAEQGAVQGADNSRADIVRSAVLYLKIASRECDDFSAAMAMLAGHRGDIPVVIVLADSGKTLRAPERYNADASDMLMAKLLALLGHDNVKLKQS